MEQAMMTRVVTYACILSKYIYFVDLGYDRLYICAEI